MDVELPMIHMQVYTDMCRPIETGNMWCDEQACNTLASAPSGFSRPQARCECPHTASFVGDLVRQPAALLQTWVSPGPCTRPTSLNVV